LLTEDFSGFELTQHAWKFFNDFNSCIVRAERSKGEFFSSLLDGGDRKNMSCHWREICFNSPNGYIEKEVSVSYKEGNFLVLRRT
jgi:hypothetical protein